VKGKAEVMANKAGVTIHKPLAIYEGNPPREIYPSSMDGMYSVAYEMDGDGRVPIAAGQLEIEAHVTIVYGVR
jgi:uncharacterized protein YggE